MDEMTALKIICERSAKDAALVMVRYFALEQHAVSASLEKASLARSVSARAEQALSQMAGVLRQSVEELYHCVAARTMEQIHARLSLPVRKMVTGVAEEHIRQHAQVAASEVLLERKQAVREARFSGKKDVIDALYTQNSVAEHAASIARLCALDVACLMMNVAEEYAAKKALHETPKYEYVIVDGIKIVKPAAGGGGGSGGGGAGGGAVAKKPIDDPVVKPVNDEAIAKSKFHDPEDLPVLQKLMDGKKLPGSISEDEVMKAMYKDQGFDGKPQIVNKKQLDAYVDSGEPELFRGVSGPYGKQFQSGDLFAGRGIYGNGTYVAEGTNALKTAKDYASNSFLSGEILRMSLKKGANVITKDDIQALQKKAMHANMGKIAHTDAESKKNQAMQRIISDEGRFALSKGYDAIVVPKAGDYGSNYYVILNRTAVRVQDTIIPHDV